MFKSIFTKSGLLNTLTNSIENSENISVFGTSFGEKLAIINSINKFVFFVASNESEADEMYNNLCNLKYNTLKFISDIDLDITNINSKSEDISAILKDDINAVVITPNILFKKYPDVKKFKEQIIEYKINDEIDIAELSNKLVNLGYSKKALVENVGDFSIRGEIIDIFPVGARLPIRLFLNFETIENIKEFDCVTMLTINEIEKISIFPSAKIEIDTNKTLKYLNNIKAKNDEQISKIELAKYKIEILDYYNNEWFLPFATNYNSSILDYIPSDAYLFFSDAKRIFDKLNEYVINYNTKIKDAKVNNNLFDIHDLLKVNIDIVISEMQNFGKCAFQNISNSNRLFAPLRVFNLKIGAVANYKNNLNLLVHECIQNLRNNYTTLIFAKSNDGVVKLTKLFDLNNLPYNVCSLISGVQKNTINILPKYYPESFSFLDEKLFVVGSNQLYGLKTVSKIATNVFTNDFLPNNGDYVVHVVHGIGKCLGVQSLNLGDSLRDFVIVEYKGGDKLYVPVENIDTISKYVGIDEPKINKIGGVEFSSTKQKIRNSLKQMATDLLKLYAARQKEVGYKYPQDDEVMKALEDSFEFDETLDQIEAIEAVKSDMEQGKVMDRLICGDVGFGKTEVAIRCAFKTILANKMVAFLCPTTILSEQHYNTCMVRLSQFGVRVEVLNRFKTEKQCEDIIKRVNNGEVDLLIGTHKILNSKIKFKSLGLLIIDEEQKFGVEHKEKIKVLKTNVNVLTLTATPIPRTLHISLVGIRDISTIETPPTSRIPTIVQVVEYSDVLLKTAIEKEIARNGQVLVVYNRVDSIYNFAHLVKELIGSEISLGVAHGQMGERELEDAIFKLYNKETQVLISTTLIENGVDLPNANTLIVINADMLGLSQLYQLKGRIGRSDRQAYAYFTYKSNKLLSENAYKRLQAINEFTSMGSGFKIALRDLEIRGAGSVIGVEQHGHLEKVGYAMYVNLLNQAIQEAKGEPIQEKLDVKVETSLHAYIPSYYISDYQSRIYEYSNISKIDSSEKLLTEFNNLKDVYGEIPEEVINICKVALIKNMSSKFGIVRVFIKDLESFIQFENQKCLVKDNILKAISYFENDLVLNVENLPIIKINLNSNLNDKVDFVINFLQLL